MSKIKRKVSQDGIQKTLITGLEFISRRYLLTPLVELAIKNNFIGTIHHDQIEDRLGLKQPHNDISSGKNSPIVISNAYVFTSTGIVVTRSGEIIRTSVATPKSDLWYLAVPFVHHLFRDGIKVTATLIQNRPRDIDQKSDEHKIISPLIPRYINYYHWMVETLPRIKQIQDLESGVQSDLTLIIPENAPTWMQESLELVTGGSLNFEKATAPVYQANKVVFTSRRELSLQDCKWLADSIREKTPINEDQPAERIYISRAKANERHVINESEVIDFLHEYGFELYQLEELSVKDQVQLFTNAEVIVSPHGAGLANMIYSTDAVIVELFGSLVKKQFEQLANTLNHEYYALQCEPIGTDLKVDQNQLQKIAEQFK